MPKTRAQKEENVQTLTNKLAEAKSVVFADYKGLNMKALSDLRNDLRKQQAEFSVTKNNLLTRALENSKLKADDQALMGPTATLFTFEDEISPIKALVQALKTAGVGSIKGGLVEGEYYDQYKIIQLSNLPSKDELRAKVVGGLGAPLYGIVGVLQANIRNLVYALDQIRVSKGGEG